MRWLSPPIGSALVLRYLDTLARSAAGRYVLEHMRRAMTTRLAGETLMAAGAWRRDLLLMAAGAALVGLGWSGGLLGWNAAEPNR